LLEGIEGQAWVKLCRCATKSPYHFLQAASHAAYKKSSKGCGVVRNHLRNHLSPKSSSKRTSKKSSKLLTQNFNRKFPESKIWVAKIHPLQPGGFFPKMCERKKLCVQKVGVQDHGRE
jgi:hypothetical protein